MNRCPNCNCRLLSGENHEDLRSCIVRLRSIVEQDAPVYELSNRRFRLVRHPEVAEGQYVFVAGWGEGTTLLLSAKHELALCIDEPTRVKLIELLTRGPEDPFLRMLTPEAVGNPDMTPIVQLPGYNR